MQYMKWKSYIGKFWAGVPPWTLLGAVAVLLPIFAFSTYENIDRQRQHETRLLLEKGAALIRSLEAGTRIGVMGIHWDSFKLQYLLTETAQQSGIKYLMVTDPTGRVVAHSNPEEGVQSHGEDLDLNALVPPDRIIGRLLTRDGENTFEVISRFSPSPPPFGRRPNMHDFQERFQKLMEDFGVRPSDNWIIFVGLDTVDMEAAQNADMRHSIGIGIILLFIGFGGFILLMLFQSNRATKRSLSQLKAFSDSLVENMPIGLLALDARKNIATLNQVAAGMLGIEVAETIWKKASDILPPDIASLVEELDESTAITDRQFDCIFPDGHILPMEITAQVHQDETGLLFGYILLLKDLSEIEELRKEVARTQRLATMGRLAAGVAHEIRNPLSSIKGLATYFKERYPDAAQDQQIAGVMIQEVDKLNRVVGQLLEFSRPVAVIKRWVPVAPLIADSLILVEKLAESRSIHLESVIPPEPLEGYLDPDRLHQVLLNLYLNAMDAMPPDGVLTVTAETDHQRLLIRVTDTGPGIPAENMAHIFDPYFTTKPSGTGLGLAIVHNIIEAHHGRIVPENKPDQGLVMTISLPLPDRKEETPERSTP